MYLLTITAALCLAYAVMLLLFPMFFREAIRPFQLRSMASLVVIGALSLMTAVVSRHIPDAALGNRFLHIVGGGLLGTLAAFLAARDSRVSITPLPIRGVRLAGGHRAWSGQ
jgi:hypothetical protein